MREKLIWVPVIVVSMVLGGAGVVGVDALRYDDGGSTTTTVIQSTSDSQAAPVAVSGISDVSDLYDRVRPSVVQINTRGAGAGLGSGIVLDKEGHILTNNHVIDKSQQIDVTLSDGTAGAAEVVGTDPGNDLAVIKAKLPADKLQPATLGDSTKTRVGEFVIAVGNPFGIDGSLTQGIVSGLGRTLGGSGGRPLRQLIQSDAAINPGNSGGALFNARGEVIGITSAIDGRAGTGGFAGIGYAVPISTFKRFMPDLLAGKPVEHPRMGISMTNLTPAAGQSLGVNAEQGVLITSVEANSAAARAGLRGGTGNRGTAVGDVVISIDGKPVRNYDELANYVDSKKVGDKISVKVMREGKETTVELTLEAWKSGS